VWGANAVNGVINVLRGCEGHDGWIGDGRRCSGVTGQGTCDTAEQAGATRVSDIREVFAFRDRNWKQATRAATAGREFTAVFARLELGRKMVSRYKRLVRQPGGIALCFVLPSLRLRFSRRCEHQRGTCWHLETRSMRARRLGASILQLPSLDLGPGVSSAADLDVHTISLSTEPTTCGRRRFPRDSPRSGRRPDFGAQPRGLTAV